MAKYSELSQTDKIKLLNTEYLGNGKSFCELAEQYETYPNRLRRDAIANGIKLHDKSVAQKNALKTGRSKHPTKGTQRSDDTKEKISESRADAWSKIDTQKREAISKQAQKQWADMPQKDKELLHKKASNAVRLAAKEGSKLEKYLLEQLVNAGHRVEFHKEHLLLNERLQIDLFLPKIGVAIEVDGPSHFLPIWGSKALQRNKKSDSSKNGLLLSRGIVVIRVKQEQNLSQKYKRDIANKVIALLQEIEINKPEEGKRYIEL